MYRGPADMSQHLTNNNLKYWECKKQLKWTNNEYFHLIAILEILACFNTQDLHLSVIKLLKRRLSLANLEMACLLRSPARPPPGVEN